MYVWEVGGGGGMHTNTMKSEFVIAVSWFLLTIWSESEEAS